MSASAKINMREVADVKRSKRRQQLINAVQQGLDMTGDALTELRDDEHWKDTHNSFHEFCKATFSISKTKLYTILKSMEVITSLPKKLQPLITSEAQVIALAKLPENKRADAISKAEKNGGVTAENISLHGAKPASKTNVTAPVTLSRTRNSTFVEKTGSESPPSAKTAPAHKEKKIELDEIGTPVPDEALPYWIRRKEILALMGKISDVKCAVEKAKLGNDALYGGVSNNFVVEMRSAYAHIKDGALPYAVCTQCMGTPSLQLQGCSFCKNTGLIPEWRWNTQAMKEVKEMRIKIAADLAAERA